MKINQVKRDARPFLKGNYLTLLVTMIVYIILSGDQIYIEFNDISLSGLISDKITDLFVSNQILGSLLFLFWIFISAPLNYGKDGYFLEVIEGDKPKISRLFQNFTRQTYFRSLGIVLLTILYTLLWSLLFVIPGIIKGFSYSQANRIARDNPELTANQAITQSREMMDGYKWKLFVMYISFLLWYIPAIILSFFGLAIAPTVLPILATIVAVATGILIRPYFETANAILYTRAKQR